MSQKQESSWLRQEQGIVVKGDMPIPPPIECFSELSLSSNVTSELKRREVTTPSPVQAQVLPCVFQGSDVVILAPTGSGKSLCYILPIVELLQRLHNQSGPRFQQDLVPPMLLTTPCALVVVPTRELVDQVTQDISAFFPRLTNPPIVGVYGGISVDDQVAALRRHASSPLAMVATPGRLLHLVQRHGTVLSLEQLSLFIVDEVDCVLDVLEMETQLRDILVLTNSTGRQTLLLSATLPAFLPRLERSAVVHPVTIRVDEVHLPTQASSLKSNLATGTSPTAIHALSKTSNVVHDVQFMRPPEKSSRLLCVLRATKHPPVLVFCNSRSSVERVARRLRQEQFHVAPLHGGQSQGYRTQALRAFRAGYVDVLVATDLASRGLDFPGVEHVILFDVPHTLESYIHRCGRTGRHPKGNVESPCAPGKATTFLTRDCVIAKELKQWLRAASQPLPRELIGDIMDFSAPR